MNKEISEAEVLYIRQGWSQGIRSDGRGAADMRPVRVQPGHGAAAASYSSPLPQCPAACRVAIGADFASDILCSIKFEVDSPDQALPEHGRLAVTADFSPNIYSKLDRRRLQDIGSQISSQIYSLLVDTSSIDLSQLCIIPGKYCWTLHVDFMIFSLDGPALDAASYAMYVALQQTRLPQVLLVEGESGAPEDFEVGSDLATSVPLPIAKDGLPIVVTCIPCACSVGAIYDATSAEMECAESPVLAVAFDKSGRNCGVISSHAAAISSDSQCLTPSKVLKCMQLSSAAASDIISKLDRASCTDGHATNSESFHPEVHFHNGDLLFA